MTSPAGGRPSRLLTRIRPGEARAGDQVFFDSRGAILICGPAALAIAAGRQLAKTLRVVVCATGDLVPGSLRANPMVISGRVASVEGCLGRFTVKAQARGGKLADLGPFSGNPDGLFDLVLDLNTPPLVGLEIPPLGYAAPGSEANAIAAAIAHFSTLTGSFGKPRQFHYDPSKCTHAAQGFAGCDLCLAVCPAAAISAGGDGIAVDAGLCQGCATCMLACPTGALSPAGTPPSASLAALLQERERAGRFPDRLLIHELADELPENHAGTDHVLAFPVPAIASAGMEIWLAALAQGVRQVLIRAPAGLPASTRSEMARQVEQAHALLAAIGEAPERIAMSDATASLPVTRSAAASFQALPMPAGEGKRATLLAALARLQSGSLPAGTGKAAALPAGAPFGTVRVDRSSCTLCPACVNVCPTGALSSPGPSLELVEGKCVQCRICEHACPEKAIALETRFLLDSAARDAPQKLQEDARHLCPGCAAPFIAKSLLERTTQTLAAKGMGVDGLARLQYCPDCRSNLRALP